MTSQLFTQTTRPNSMTGNHFGLFNRPTPRPTARLFRASQPRSQNQTVASRPVSARRPAAAASFEGRGRLEDSYNRIVQLYQSVPVADLLEPVLANGWSVKDLLAHIAAWQWRFVGLLKLAQETNMPFRAKPDVEALNQEFYEERQTWSWEKVEADLRDAHAALLQTIQALPPERLADELLQKTIAQETWQRYDKHLADLQQWRKQMINHRRQVARYRSPQPVVLH